VIWAACPFNRICSLRISAQYRFTSVQDSLLPLFFSGSRCQRPHFEQAIIAFSNSKKAGITGMPNTGYALEIILFFNLYPCKVQAENL
jgi:hypothetical protein